MREPNPVCSGMSRSFFCFSAARLYGSPNSNFGDPHNPVASIYLGKTANPPPNSGPGFTPFAIRSLAIFKQVLNDAAIKATYTSGKLPIMCRLCGNILYYYSIYCYCHFSLIFSLKIYLCQKMINRIPIIS